MLSQQEFEDISKIVAAHGFVEWSLTAFAANSEHEMFSYFTDHRILPIYRRVLVDTIKKIDEYLGSLEHLPCKGNC